MTDEEPSGDCIICFRRDAYTKPVCDVDRSKLRTWLGDIPSLFAELQGRIDEMSEPLDHRPYVATVVETAPGTKKRVTRVWQVLTMRAADQVSYLLPAGGTSSPSRTGPVSGSKEPRLPIDVDEVDLLGPPRPLMPERDFRGEDEAGHDAVASVLDFWARDWREARGGLERLPDPYVPALASWLLRRVDDAMDAHPAIDEMWNDVRRIHGALRVQIGDLEPRPQYLNGIPCGRCKAQALWRVSGSEYAAECGACGWLPTEEEYDEHVKARAVEARRILRSDKPAA